MSSAAVHMIHRQTLELRLRSREKAASLQQQVRDLYAAQVLPLLDQLFTQAAGPEETLVIDRLVIDLGVLKAAALDEQFCEQLRTQLREKLDGLKQDARNGIAGISPQQETQVVTLHEGSSAVLNFLRHYFTQGTLPWWIPDEQEPPDADKLILELLEQQSPMLVQLLFELRRRPEALQRIRQQLSPPVFARVIEALLRELPAGLQAAPALIAELGKGFALLHKKASPAEELLLPALLLLPDQGHAVTALALPEQTLQSLLAAAAGIAQQTPEQLSRIIYLHLLKALAARKNIPAAAIFARYFRWWETKHEALAFTLPPGNRTALSLLPADALSEETKLSAVAAAALAEIVRGNSFAGTLAAAAREMEEAAAQRGKTAREAQEELRRKFFFPGENEEEESEEEARVSRKRKSKKTSRQKKAGDKKGNVKKAHGEKNAGKIFPGTPGNDPWKRGAAVADEDAGDEEETETLSSRKSGKKKNGPTRSTGKKRAARGKHRHDDPGADAQEPGEEASTRTKKRGEKNAPGTAAEQKDLPRSFRLEPGRPFLKPVQDDDDEQAGEQKARTAETEEEIRRTPRTKSEHLSLPWREEEEPVTIMTRYAGIVLVAPFLPPFFGELGLLDDAGIFREPAAAHKALHLLNLVAGGKSRPQEYTLALHKILCGIKVTAPVPRLMKISAKEKKEALLLLDEIAAQWTAMKTGSGRALQQAFMKRNGIIERKDGALLLRIERTGIDIMLDTLPWSISLIRHTWMEQMLHVEW